MREIRTTPASFPTVAPQPALSEVEGSRRLSRGRLARAAGSGKTPNSIPNSLFPNILPATPSKSIFCRERGRYPHPNPSAIKILARCHKKNIEPYPQPQRPAAQSDVPCAFVIISLPPPRTKRTPLALDEKIYEQRREKLKQIEALGQPTY